MLVYSEECNTLTNLQNINTIYVAGDYSIRTNSAADSYRLGIYRSAEIAGVALKMLVERISGTRGEPVIKMPTDAEVDLRHQRERTNSYYKDGGDAKKQKSHGGS